MPETNIALASKSVQIVFCTCPDEAVAEKISAALVEGGLAACVNQLGGVISTYRWDHKICRDEEYLLIIKTTAAAFDDLRQCICGLHPYELPEIIAVPCTGGSGAYLEWVAANTLNTTTSQ